MNGVTNDAGDAFSQKSYACACRRVFRNSVTCVICHLPAVSSQVRTPLWIARKRPMTCAGCDAPLRPHNLTGLCAECNLVQENPREN